MKKVFLLGIGMTFVIIFWSVVYKVLPLGPLLSVIGGVMATLSRDKDRIIRITGLFCSWLYPFGTIYTFYSLGILWGG